MIWILLLIFALIAAIYLTAPLLPAKTRDEKMVISVFIALFIGASLGTYNLIGAPNLSNASNIKTAAPSPPQQVQQPSVTPEQITAMVDGLAARLAEDPEDPDGWTRLIRSRMVLGDIPQLIQDHKAMSETYKTRPEIIIQISQDSGFNDFVARVMGQP